MKQKKEKKLIYRKRGSALLLTTILLFVILSMVVSLTYVTVMEQKISSKTKSSVGAFYSAESGIEWALNKIANTTESTISGAFGSERFNSDGSVKCPDSFGADICKVYLLNQDGKVITNLSLEPSEIKAVRSVGTQNTGEPTQRAIEAAVGAGPCWCAPSDVTVTTVPHNGNFGGYQGMYDWIQDNGCRGYHVCDSSEITRYYQTHPTASLVGFYNSGYGVVYSPPQGGGDGQQFDCHGWTHGGEGAGTVTSGWNNEQPVYSGCGDSKVMCCK